MPQAAGRSWPIGLSGVAAAGLASHAGGRIRQMEFSEVVRRRRMVRHYSSRPLAAEVIERVLASALRAPSSGVSQGWAFLALTVPADRAPFWRDGPTRGAWTPPQS